MNAEIQKLMLMHNEGFGIIPTLPNSKQPAVAWKTYNTQRTMPRTPDKCNWSGVCYAPNFVIDIDPKNNADALDEFAAMPGALLDTRVHSTPSGGLHIFYKSERANWLWVNGEDSKQNENFPYGVDSICMGSKPVMLPPSAINGVPYRVRRDMPIAAMPRELERLCVRPRTKEREARPVLDCDPEEYRWILRASAPMDYGEWWPAASALVKYFSVEEVYQWSGTGRASKSAEHAKSCLAALRQWRRAPTKYGIGTAIWWARGQGVRPPSSLASLRN